MNLRTRGVVLWSSLFQSKYSSSLSSSLLSDFWPSCVQQQRENKENEYVWLINGECDSSTNLAKTTFAKDFNKIEVVCGEFADPGHAGFDWFSVFVPYGFIWIHITVAAITRFSLANKVLSTLEMLNRYILNEKVRGWYLSRFTVLKWRIYLMILFCAILMLKILDFTLRSQVELGGTMIRV